MAAVQENENVAIEEVIGVEEEFKLIDELETLGVNRAEIKKAKDAGYHTVGSLLMHPSKVLCEIKGLSENKIKNMVEAARKMTPAYSFRTAKEVDAQRIREIVYISTGSDAVDAVLGGGIETKAVTEISGEFRCGKTQMCLTMAVTAQINSKNPGKVAYIDTEGAFRPSRIAEIAERFGIESESVLDNVHYVKAQTWEHQVAMLVPLAAMMASEPFKLIIVDSVIANYRGDFIGRGELADRQQRLGQMLNALKKLAEEYNVAVFVTNHVMSDPSGGAMFVSDPKKACGGHMLAHAVHTRLSVRKGKAEQRVLKVVQSPSMPEDEASFCITKGGVVEYKD